MDKVKISRKHVKRSQKFKANKFNLETFEKVKLKKGQKHEYINPTEGLELFSSLSSTLMESLIDNDTESFKDILAAHIGIVGKERVAKLSGVSLRTIFRMLEPKSNPTLNNLSKVFQALGALEIQLKKQATASSKKAA